MKCLFGEMNPVLIEDGKDESKRDDDVMDAVQIT